MSEHINLHWPDTERKHPVGARLSIRYVHDNWMDLCWLNPRGEWQYISTLPRIKIIYPD